MPESLIKRLTQNSVNSGDAIEKNASEAFKLIVEKISESPRLGKREARNAAVCNLNPFYSKFVEQYLTLKNFEEGAATKDYLSALTHIAKAIGGINSDKSRFSLFGLGGKEK